MAISAAPGLDLGGGEALPHQPQGSAGERINAAAFGIEEARQELIDEMMHAQGSGRPTVDQGFAVAREAPEHGGGAVLGGDGAALFLDDERGDAEQIEFVGTGRPMAPFVLRVMGIEAHHHAILGGQGVDEVEAEGGAVLPAVDHVFRPDMVFAAESGDNVAQKRDALRRVVDVEGRAQLHAGAVADQGSMGLLGVVDGHAHDFFRLAGLGEHFFDCGITAVEYAVHGTTSYGFVPRRYGDGFAP